MLKASALPPRGRASSSIPLWPSRMPAHFFTSIHCQTRGPIQAASHFGQQAGRTPVTRPLAWGAPLSFRARALAIPHTQACVYKRWQAIPALTGRGIIQEQLIGSLSRSIHVLTLSRIARSQLLIKHASDTQVIPHFTPLSRMALCLATGMAFVLIKTTQG